MYAQDVPGNPREDPTDAVDAFFFPSRCNAEDTNVVQSFASCAMVPYPRKDLTDPVDVFVSMNDQTSTHGGARCALHTSGTYSSLCGMKCRSSAWGEQVPPLAPGIVSHGAFFPTNVKPKRLKKSPADVQRSNDTPAPGTETLYGKPYRVSQPRRDECID